MKVEVLEETDDQAEAAEEIIEDQMDLSEIMSEEIEAGSVTKEDLLKQIDEELEVRQLIMLLAMQHFTNNHTPN